MSELLSESLVDGSDEIQGVQVGRPLYAVGASHADSKILGHLSVLDCFDGSGLEGVAEVFEFRVVVQFSSVEQTTGPGEDTGDGVGRSLSAFLMFSVVSGDGSMGSFGFDCTVRGVEDGGHESKRSIS